ncbi:MAG: peptide chain release factor 2 [Chthonomonadales bacterium]
MPIEDTRRIVKELHSRTLELGDHLDLAGKRLEIEDLERQAADPQLWEDSGTATLILQKLTRAREAVAPVVELQRRAEDLLELAEIADDEDAALQRELDEEVRRLNADVERMELEMLLSGEHDGANAIVEINAGAGGTESCDWVQMLLRMYLRWAQEQGYRVELTDQTEGEVAGLKSVTFIVQGPFAYGYLQSERGVHRLVRISPFDANKRRHTSFASVDVIPEVQEAEEIAINPEELRIDTFRSSGAGGQHVNKTDSAVRITHLPTGIVVTCQNERSQHKNRAMAMKVLQARLMERERRQNEARMAELRGEQAAIEWGNQIRSYVFQPYTLVKDHRTGYETGDILRVMDGAINPFIQAYLKWKTGKS